MTNYLQVENLTKSFGDNLLFDNISFSITDNQRVATSYLFPEQADWVKQDSVLLGTQPGYRCRL